MIGQTFSHYKITDKLGAGGMGEVYLALDTKLQRHVALKFLPESLRSDPEARERLLREARAASKLNHPNILTIHAVEEYEGRDFIVMEYVEGKPLTDSSAEGRRSISNLLDIAIAVADGLQKAHSGGVIHRDIKPANILIDTDGHPRILDFGLAMVHGASRLTQTGSTTGTAAYMSPEQAQGAEIDARSDLFSFGVVLYEMIAGRAPFAGDHQVAVAYAIVNETPEPLSRYKADVPSELQRIVTKCLAKSPKERYQSAADLLADLRALRTVIQVSSPSARLAALPKTRSRKGVAAIVIGVAVLAVAAALIVRQSATRSSTATSQRKMLAVLPFENLGSPDQEFFADGITDEITGKLAAIRDLGVISRTSTMQYKKTTKNLRDIAKELGVNYILEGTILWDKGRDTSRVRILPQLIRVSDDTHLWAETYERPLTGIFALQADIANRIAEAMNITLLGSEHAALEAMPTKNLEAYQAYLRGIDYSGRADQTKENWQLAVQMFQRAVQLDSTFALAYAHLSYVHAGLVQFGFDVSPDRLAWSKAAADRALALQPELPWAHISLGYYYYWCHRDYDNALRELSLAEVGLPNNQDVLGLKGFIWRRQGKFRPAIEQLEQAFLLNPRNASLTVDLAGTYSALREYKPAMIYLDKSITLEPDQTNAYVAKVTTYYPWSADTSAIRATLASIPKQDDDRIRISWFWLKFFERDYAAALDEIPLIPSMIINQVNVIPRVELTGMVHFQRNEPGPARACFDSARIILDKELTARPEDPRLHSSLGMVYAGLGRKDDAIREGKLGVELFPVSLDALLGPRRVEDLARIYVIVGEYDAAMDRLEYLHSIPSGITTPLLRLDPRFDPLRDLPRFKKLLEQPDKVF